jgi:hypothetical protein
MPPGCESAVGLNAANPGIYGEAKRLIAADIRAPGEGRMSFLKENGKENG